METVALTIYSRPGCHLCEDMKTAIERAVGRTDLDVRIEEIDISTDPELEARYGTEIPVLFVNGKKAAKYRISEWELARLLRSRADALDG
jgi:glutaredoxin